MRAVREYRTELVGRVRTLTLLVAAALVAIAAGFWFVQLVQGGYYGELAENNRLRQLPVRAPRGLIYDRDGRPLVENVPSYTLLLDRSRAADLDASMAFAAAALDRPLERLADELAKAHGQAEFVPVPVARNLTLAQVARFSATGLEHPEFEVVAGQLRLYRHGWQTSHVLGYIGEVSEADLARGYDSGDLVGKEGVELTYDRRLRGADGERVVVVDSRGKILEEHRREPARPGAPLHLTLDLELQQAAERLMRDKVGAVVALEPSSGEVLALVSSPAYDPNQFARGLEPEEWRALVDNPDKPLQDRAIHNAHSPGSVFKIVMASAGLAEGVIDAHARVYCQGSTTIYNHRFGCWKAGGHGWVDLHRAIRESCNVYFYHLGQKLGIERIARWSRAFGLGTPTGIDLRGEKSGLVPDPDWSREVRRTPWYPGETISVAIGQGSLLVTPVQMARMVAAVANGGRLIEPHLVRGEVAEAPRLPLSPETLDAVRRGLEAVVNEPGGTAYWVARVPGADIAGKTGTVQVVARTPGVRGEDLPYALRNHAWFVSFAPADHPRLVLVVFVEHGGAGSSGAAPIAKALYEKYFQAELAATAAAG
jgi:penicillin-binding protein 2